MTRYLSCGRNSAAQ